ncbi:unnamed protein product [Malus baccata var. baccata]
MTKSSHSSFSFPSSTSGLLRLLLMAAVILSLLFVTSAATPISNPTNATPRNPHRLHSQETHHHRECDHQTSASESSSAQLRSLCLQLTHHRLFHASLPLSPLPPVSPSGPSQPAPGDRQDGHEIDPRYGVEKRLVPSGPNPLHN